MIGWLWDQIGTLIGLALLLVLAAAVYAPLESLSWFAGWSGKKPDPREFLKLKDKVPPPDPANIKKYYLIYLSGIGAAEADGLNPEEAQFVERLAQMMPDAEVIVDVFPYSVNNNPLTGERALTPLWRLARDRQAKNPNDPLALVLVNIRNFLQVFVSADPRYGPIYGMGLAQEIAKSLVRHNYPLGTGKPLFLIGYSGGGQVSIGAAPYITPVIGGPVYVITVGGFLSDDPSVQQVKVLLHQYGDKDPLQGMAAYLWSGRWPMMQQSPWNRSVRAGKIKLKSLGPMAHNGTGWYYDSKVTLPDGRTYQQATAEAIKGAVEGAE